jgi:hypothetical protein
MTELERELLAALEDIAAQTADRNKSDDYNRGWEAARYSARQTARAAIAKATPTGEGM